MAAQSGAFETNHYEPEGGGWPSQIRVEWSSTQHIASNSSTISYTIKSWGGSHGYTMVGPVKVSLAGRMIYDRSDRFEMWYTDTLASGSFTVQHNDSGNYKLEGWAEAAIYSYAISSTRYGYSCDLPTIARASSVSCNAGTMGSQMTISITRASSSFTHTLKWSFGNQSGTIVDKTSNTSVGWTPSIELARQVPSATSGTGTITCETYSGSTKVGTTTCQLKLSVPSNIVPSINSFTSSVVNGLSGNYVKNKSKVTWSVVAYGQYDSWITGYSISGHNLSSSSSSATSGTITQAGNLSYTVKVTDSRGRTSSLTKTISVWDYAGPRITSVSSYRSDSNKNFNGSGTYVMHKINTSFYNIGGNNNIVLNAYYKERSSSTYTHFRTIKNDANTTAYYEYLSGTFPLTNAYDFKFTISDSYGESHTYYTSVGTKSMPLNIAKNNNSVSIGGFAQSSTSGRFDCNWPAHFISAPIVSSDRKLKRNIEDIDVNIIDLLRPVQYNLIEGDGNVVHYGFVAQDVEQSIIDSGLTESTTGIIHYDEDEVTKEKTNYAIAYEEIIPFLVKKCQELQREIDELKENKTYSE